MNGSIIWVYSAEVAVDTALGICILVLWTWVLILSLTTNYLMEALNTYGVFWLFGISSFIGGIFDYFFVRETVGLNDKQRKSLYMPKSLIAERESNEA
jgi:hypothetical protein